MIGQKVANPKKSWLRAVKAAGIEDLHFHDLRLEAGSWLLEAGWLLHHVRDMLGHADLKTTDNYINTSRHGLHESMRRFGTRALHPVAQQADESISLACNKDQPSTAKSLVN